MRVALAQVNPTVGDIAGNTELVLSAVTRARDAGADLTILPELVLTGYPPEDLLLKDHFVDDSVEALHRVAAACTSAVLVGFADRGENGEVHNAAALCRDGVVERVYHKRHLPNYGVFDEWRYFAPGDEPVIVDVAGVPVAVTICEDVWVPESATEVAKMGARVIANLSASPFHAGKGATREAMLRSRAADNGVWLAYANLTGGQDELVFDGRSVVIAPSGEVVGRAGAFAEDLLVVEFDPNAGAGLGVPLAPPEEGPAEVYAALVTGLGDYARKNGFSDVAVGLSGGIDSALVACVAADALSPGRVHGVMMPSRYSSRGSIADAEALGHALGIDLREISIEPGFSANLHSLEPSFEGMAHDVTEENLQARVRGTLLMALSNKFGWLVLATGNKSELSVGYSTLYGDMVGGFAPLKDVFKTRVYELARWRNERGPAPVIPEATLLKAPSAELRPDQIDQDTLPPYDELDAILERYVEADESRGEIVAAGFDAQLVERVVRMTDAAEYKRRQGALGTKITPKAFGRDRRMPVTNRYRER